MIIKCPECGKEISDKATSCPHCGCPQSAWAEDQADASVVDPAVEAERKELDEFWAKGRHNSEFVMHEPAPGAQTAMVECLTCGELFSIPLSDIDRRGDLYLIKKYCSCRKCCAAISRGYIIKESDGASKAPARIHAPSANSSGGRRCPKCGGSMNVQTVSESPETGCGTVLLYFLLAITVVGLLIIIPLALRKKTVTRTYAVCQNCGYNLLLREE